MKRMQRKKQRAIVLSGGLDVVTSQLGVQEGRLLENRNYECDLNGGYRQFSGYERFDGQTAPSEGEYVTITYTAASGPFTEGEVVTGGTSGATGNIFYQGTDAMYLGDVTGAFVEAETLTGGTSTETATSTSPSYANVVVSLNDTRNNIRFRKENYYRQAIQPIPGEGTALGAFRHSNVTLAARDISGVEKRIYKSTAAGWEDIPRVYTIFYENKVGGQDLPLPGDTIDDGTNSATVFRVGRPTVAGDSGYITLLGYTTGFANSAILRNNAVQFAQITASGGASEFILADGGRVEWRSFTFSGNPDQYRCYFVDGVNPCMEYDPVANVIGPIYTDLADIANDIPKFLEIYKSHLFVGYARGIMRNSEPLDPYLWDAAAGSLEIQIGAEVTGMQSNPSSLIVTTRRKIFALQGSSAANFQLDNAGENVGAKAYSLNILGTPYMMDDRGIIELSRVESFGNFENATVSRFIQPIVKDLVNSIQGSAPNLTNNLLRFFTRDGEGICMTLQEGKVFGFGRYDLKRDLYFITNAEDETGAERTFFGGTDGYVFEMDRGVNFDGVTKQCWFQTSFNHLGSPSLRKRFFRAFITGVVEGQSSVSMVAQYSNNSPDVAETLEVSDTAIGNRAGWDVGTWDVMFFDAGSSISDVYLDMTGTGDTVSIVVYSETDQDDILTFRDILYKYIDRRSHRSSR